MDFTIDIDVSAFQKMAKEFPVKFKAQCAAAATRSGDLIKKEIDEAFVSGGPKGARWPALSTKYANWKARHGYDAGILLRTYLLARSFTFKREGLGGWVGILPGISWPAGLPGKKTVAEVMDIHEQWSRSGGSGMGKMPKRALFKPISDYAAPKIKAIYEQALQEAIK